MEKITSEQLHAAWQKCEDAWQAVGAYVPCYEEKYMEAREEYALLLMIAKKQSKRAA